MSNILANIPLSLVLTLISSIAALFTAYYSYRAIKVNRELFYKTQEAEEQRLLPLFNVYKNYKFLDENGMLVHENPNPEEIISLYFVNINHNPIASIMATEEKSYKNNVDPLISPNIINAINYTENGVILNIRKKEVEDKDYKITIRYLIQTNKTYTTELIVSINYGVFVTIKAQKATKLDTKDAFN